MTDVEQVDSTKVVVLAELSVELETAINLKVGRGVGESLKFLDPWSRPKCTGCTCTHLPRPVGGHGSP